MPEMLESSAANKAAGAATRAANASLKPTEVVREYWELSSNGNLDQTRQLTTNSVESVVVQDESKPSWAEIIHDKHLVLNAVLDEEPKDSEAKVIAEVTEDGSSAFKLRHDLYYKDGAWKIVGIYYLADLPDPVPSP